MNKKKSKLSEFIEEIKKEVSAESIEDKADEMTIDSDRKESAQTSGTIEESSESEKDKIIINIKDIKKEPAKDIIVADTDSGNDQEEETSASLVDAIIQKDSNGQTASSSVEVTLTEQEKEDKKIIDALTAERDELKDKFLRKAAELENYIKRSRKEKEELRDLVVAEFALKLLSVSDNFERALSITNSTAEQLLAGLKLTQKQLFDILEEYGLHSIPNMVGQTFDPQIHEAIFIEPTDKYPVNTIIEEYLKGYLYKDFTLRPSKVRVAVAMPDMEESAESEQPSAMKEEMIDTEKEQKTDNDSDGHSDDVPSSKEENN